MSNEADLYISNGTCYYGQGQVSDPRYIPCGNAQLSGVQHCCFEGSYCLKSYACYDTPSEHSPILPFPRKIQQNTVLTRNGAQPG